MPRPLLLRSLVVSLCGAPLLLAACQDPSGVGLDVIGEEGSDPNVTVVATSGVTVEEEDEFSGGFGSNLAPAQRRVLVGAAVDPLLGSVAANAYVDIAPPPTVPDGFRDRTITSATLRLVRDYVYGDSTVAVPLELYELTEGFNPIDAPLDTTFATGALLVAQTVTAQDTVVTFELPSSWVTANDVVLRSDTVNTAVDGFHVRLPEGAVPGAVMGFDTALSTLEVRTAEDTVDYPLFEVLSNIERGNPGPLPADLVYIRAAANETVALDFPLEELGALILANATLRLNVDPSVLETPGFARGLPESLTLYGRTVDDARIAILPAELDATTNSYSFSSTSLTAFVQESLLGDAILTRFELSASPSPISLGAVPLVVGPEPPEGAPDPRPRFALTIVPLPGG